MTTFTLLPLFRTDYDDQHPGFTGIFTFPLFFNRRIPIVPIHTRRRSALNLQPEHLELRIYPTVKVNFNPNSGVLKITGDNAANRIDLDFLDIGDMEVFVDTELVGTFEGVVSIKAKLKGGDDRLLLNGIRTGSLTANLGTGPDSDVYFGGVVNVNFGGDLGDLLDFDDAIRFREDASFKGVSDVTMVGDGASYGANIDFDVYFDKNLTVTFGKSSDVNGDNREINLASVVVKGVAKFTGTNAVERFESITSNFENFEMNLSGGNDFFDIIDNVSEQNRFGTSLFNGGAGDDGLTNANQIFDTPPTFIGIEQISDF